MHVVSILVYGFNHIFRLLCKQLKTSSIAQKCLCVRRKKKWKSWKYVWLHCKWQHHIYIYGRFIYSHATSQVLWLCYVHGLPLLGSLAGRKRQGANYGRGCTTERERARPVQGMFVSILCVYVCRIISDVRPMCIRFMMIYSACVLCDYAHVYFIFYVIILIILMNVVNEYFQKRIKSISYNMATRAAGYHFHLL